MTGAWCVVRVTPDRLGRRRLAYFAGFDLVGGASWSRSVRACVLVGTMHEAGEWCALARNVERDGRVSLCRLEAAA